VFPNILNPLVVVIPDISRLLKSTLVKVDIPVTFKFAAVIIPVRLIEGTSNCPNNLPFNTKSPLIV